MDSYTNVSRKHRDYYPRSSKSTQLEEAGYPVEECPTPRPSNEEWAEESKIEVNKAHDTLIQMGGKPTRPIQFNPRWEKVLVEGELCYQYAEHEETLFHDSFHGNRKGDLNTSLTEANYGALGSGMQAI